MSLLAYLRFLLGDTFVPKAASPLPYNMDIEDLSGPFDTTISKILDTLEQRNPEEHSEDTLRIFIECCRLFATGPIPNYPNWQVQKTEYANAIPSTPEMKDSKYVALMVSNLIDEISYAAIEQEGLEEAERILQIAQTINMGKELHA